MIEKEKGKHRPGRTAWLIVLIVMFGGMLLFVTAPVVLAPPLYNGTWLFYVMVLLAWIPVYVLFAWRRPVTARTITIIIVAGGLLWSSACFTSLPRRAFFTLVFMDVVKCEEQPIPEESVRYVCTRYSEGNMTGVQVIEGPRWLPLLRVAASP